MSDNNRLFDMTILAEATYADFLENRVPLTDENALKARLNANKWSQTQAEEFLTHYRVVSQQPNTVTGYSATLFERLNIDGSGTGQYVFAQRGTEPLVQMDLLDAPFGLDLAVDIGDLPCFSPASSSRFLCQSAAWQTSVWCGQSRFALRRRSVR